MEQTLQLVQNWEGSLIVDRAMGIAVVGGNQSKYSYIFKIFEGNTLQIKTSITQNPQYYFKPTSYATYTVEAEIYERGKLIKELKGLTLDFIEDFAAIKQTAFVQEGQELVVRVETEFGLPKETFAYYLKKDNEMIEKTSYTANPWWRFKIRGEGSYSVQVFVRFIKNSGIGDLVSTNTKEIRV
ncbi:MAG: hypothetical protein ACRDDX_06920 [Cellulosilyticaceae bacterium]